MKKEWFSIPNLMGYFRILMLPVFLYLYRNADTGKDYTAAFLLLAVVFLTDALDGYIARTFHMVTKVGKVLDPVADKLVQGTLALAVSFRHPFMIVFFVIFVCKELYMFLMGLYLLKTRNSLSGAQWYGKICTAVLDICVLVMLFLPGLPETICRIMIIGMVILEIFVLMKYIGFHRGILKEPNHGSKTIKR